MGFFLTGEKAFDKIHRTSETRKAAGSGAPVPSAQLKVEHCLGCVTHPGLQFSAEQTGDYLYKREEAGPRAALETAGRSDRERNPAQGSTRTLGVLRNSTSPKPAVHFLYFSYRKNTDFFFF